MKVERATPTIQHEYHRLARTLFQHGETDSSLIMLLTIARSARMCMKIARFGFGKPRFVGPIVEATRALPKAAVTALNRDKRGAETRHSLKTLKIMFD